MVGAVKYVPQRRPSPFGSLRICMGWHIVLAWQKCIQALIRGLWTGSEISEVLCFICMQPAVLMNFHALIEGEQSSKVS